MMSEEEREWIMQDNLKTNESPRCASSLFLHLCPAGDINQNDKFQLNFKPMQNQSSSSFVTDQHHQFRRISHPKRSR